jgi:hypothetical protein
MGNEARLESTAERFCIFLRTMERTRLSLLSVTNCSTSLNYGRRWGAGTDLIL